MAGKKVLLVDDESDFVELVRERLEANGFTVVTAYDGEEALAKVPSEKPDIIVLDIMMPKLNGFDACLKLKTDERHKHIPVIMLTAKFQANDIRFGQAVGADAYVTKPFEPKAFIDKIEELLKTKK